MITEHEARPVAALVGEFVARYRKTHRITRDNLARAGASYGMTWGRTSVENIEAGRFAPTIGTLYALRGALQSQSVAGNPITLADMLATDGLIELSEGYAVSPERLQAFLGGSGEAVETIADGFDDYLRSLSTPAPTPSLAEQRAAKRLGISVGDLQDVAMILWGESLDRLITQEAGEGATAQARGHANRRLVAELAAQLPDLLRRLAETRAAADG